MTRRRTPDYPGMAAAFPEYTSLHYKRGSIEYAVPDWRGAIDKDGQPILSRDGGMFWHDCTTVTYVFAVRGLDGLTALAEWVRG